MKLILTAIIVCVQTIAWAQSQLYPLAAQVEPDYFDRLVKTKTGFFSIAKVRGSSISSSTYSLNAHAVSLDERWRLDFKLDKNQNVVYLQYANEECRVYINQFDNSDMQSLLTVRRYSEQDGSYLGADTLFNETLEEWTDYGGKGVVKESLNEAICSKQLANSVSPLEYRYQFEASPNASKLLIYRYNYGGKTLGTHAKVFNQDLSLFGEAEIPVDHMYIVFDYKVNDRGDVFVAKANRGGKVAVIQYHLAEKTHKYLAIEMSNYQRDNLQMLVYSDDVVYLSKLNKTRGVLQSVGFSVFNFENESVDKHNNYELSEEEKSNIKNQEKTLGYEFEEEWKGFKVTDFWHDSLGATYIVLEEQLITSVSYEYEEEGAIEKKKWYPEDGQVKTGTLLIYKINADRSLAWKNYVVKQQMSDISDGLNSVSYRVSQNDDLSIDIFFAESTNGISLNKIRWVNISTEGEVQDDLIENPDKLVFLRSYFLDLGNEIIFVGKKGLIGKKTYLTKINH